MKDLSYLCMYVSANTILPRVWLPGSPISFSVVEALLWLGSAYNSLVQKNNDCTKKHLVPDDKNSKVDKNFKLEVKYGSKDDGHEETETILSTLPTVVLIRQGLAVNSTLPCSVEWSVPRHVIEFSQIFCFGSI